MGVVDDYAAKAFAYRPARAADAHDLSDLEICQRDAAATCGWGGY
jgi:hypothetical protein